MGRYVSPGPGPASVMDLIYAGLWTPAPWDTFYWEKKYKSSDMIRYDDNQFDRDLTHLW